MGTETGNNLDTQLRRKIVEIGRRLYDRALVAANEGNISARLLPERILITPAGFAKGRLTEGNLVVVNSSGNPEGSSGRLPSSELGMHLAVYRLRPDVAACVHAHPPYAVACSVAGVSLAEPVLPEIVTAIGAVGEAEYATPSTPEVAASISGLVPRHDAIILKNHGVLTVGPDLETAWLRMEMVEHLAQVVFLAHQLGRIDRLTPEQVQRLSHAEKQETRRNGTENRGPSVSPPAE